MRISDWSSDVCSSDLGPQKQRIHDIKKARPCPARPWIAGLRLGDDCGKLAFQRVHFLAALELQQFELRPVARFGIGDDSVDQLAERADADRKSVEEGNRVSVRVGLGGRRSAKKKNKNEHDSDNQNEKENN